MKLLLITERTDASIGLRLAGVQTVNVRNAEAAAAELNCARSDADMGVLMITPGMEKLCPDILAEIRSAGRPLLVTIPDSDNKNENTSVISDYIKNAIGIKID
ncbi:MAG: V-type ATP synthase subunit F [Clostridiaceae bacterium]|nr:V-type ATP synthase subunit F [Clostridiaceae bacterium]